MSAVPFDTLKFARHLEASGMVASVAAGAAEALADALTGSDLATKSDLAELRGEIAGLRSDLAGKTTELRSEIAAVRTDLRSEIATVRTELRSEIATVRTKLAAVKADLTHEIAATKVELRSDIELLRRDITIKFGSMLVIAVGVLLTAIRYLPPHP
jgi:hypothetical protein